MVNRLNAEDGCPPSPGSARPITIDLDTAERNTAILGKVIKAPDGKAGIYGAVFVEASCESGDGIEVANEPDAGCLGRGPTPPP